MSRRPRPNKVKKIIKNLKQTFDDGQYYEGEQMLKTIHARLMNQEDFDQASTLLTAGAMILFEHKQTTAGIEIVNDLIETWTKADKKIDNEIVDSLCKMYQLIAMDQVESKVDFIRHINNWVKQMKSENQSKYLNKEKKNSDNNSNNKDESKSENENENKVIINYYQYSKENIEIDNYLTKLYTLHGICLQNAKLFNLASVAFTKAKNVDCQVKLCQLWYNDSKLSKSNEYFFLLTRMVIQFLVIGAVKQARQFTNQVVNKSLLQRHPLENFMDLLVESIEKKSIQLYEIVCRTYLPLVKSDPQLVAYMTKVADVCLGIPPPRQGGGLLGNIMSLFS